MPTLFQYVENLGREIQGLVAFASTSVSSSTTTVISSAFISDEDPASRWPSAWLYAKDGNVAGDQRVIKRSGLAPTTGTFTVSRAFSATPGSGVNYWLLTKLPYLSDPTGMMGLRECVNQALREISINDHISVSAVSSQTRYTLDTSTYPWLREPGRIVEIIEPRPNATDIRRAYGGPWTMEYDAETVILQMPASPYVTGDTFEIRVNRPGNSRLKISGTWTDQTSPLAELTTGTDEAIPSLADVKHVSFELAYQALARRGPVDPFMESLRERYERKAAGIRFRTANPQPAETNIRFGNAWVSGAFR